MIFNVQSKQFVILTTNKTSVSIEFIFFFTRYWKFALLSMFDEIFKWRMQCK